MLIKYVNNETQQFNTTYSCQENGSVQMTLFLQFSCSLFIFLSLIKQYIFLRLEQPSIFVKNICLQSKSRYGFTLHAYMPFSVINNINTNIEVVLILICEALLQKSWTLCHPNSEKVWTRRKIQINAECNDLHLKIVEQFQNNVPRCKIAKTFIIYSP